MSLSRYCQVHASGQTPRHAEQRLVAEVTADLEAAIASGARGGALVPALHRNREMWALFAAACGDRDNALPAELRAGIVSLSLWVSRYSSEIAAGREPVEPLLEVNRQLVEGLAPPAAGMGAAASAANAA